MNMELSETPAREAMQQGLQKRLMKQKPLDLCSNNTFLTPIGYPIIFHNSYTLWPQIDCSGQELTRETTLSADQLQMGPHVS